MGQHVAIVGGGFSGAMLAVHLLRLGSRVTLVERKGDPGRGLAYGAADPIHLLNVRAGNMSAYPDAPAHFAEWLGERGVANAAPTFAARRVFGDYIEEQLASATSGAADRFTHIQDDAVDIETGGRGAAVSLGGGSSLQADAAVLALGNLPPPAPPGIDPARLPPGAFFADPWAPGAAAGLTGQDEVLVVGTGLTMVDIVLLLEARGFTGPIVALSRRGLVPLPHGDDPPTADRRSSAPAALDSALVRELRERAAAIPWRHAVDELRPFTQQLWHVAPLHQRRRFVRHLRPWWDIHRHRIAPEVHARIQSLIRSGRLRVGAGKLLSATAGGAGVAVHWRPRGSDAPEGMTFSRIINCTGPEADLGRSREPLLRRLLDRGAIRPGPIGLGIDVDGGARVLDATGTANPRLLALGPLTRGMWWEIIAVPDIRSQVADVAASLSRQEQP